MKVRKPRQPITHYVKTWPEFYQEVKSGRKGFEVRKNNRDFREGDTIVLQEWDKDTEQYSGDESTFDISYVLYGPGFGIEKGYCVMQLVN